ncbi:MAG: response regulator transcription factor [Chloroflexi bacterium]|nr:response regulator transcription factor [Chloroflexota bacterium]
MAEHTVLIVEDEENLAVALRYNLEREGYEVRVATDGTAGLQIALTTSPDLLILDVMLPGMSGYDICKEVRRKSDVPILMLTARGEEVDKVVGLELGADDYVTKPFSVRELMARVRALLRRPRTGSSTTGLQEPIRSGDLEVDPVSHVARKGGEVLELKPREFDLLGLMVANPGRAYTRNQLLETLWGHDYVGDSRTVDVHIRWLRKKIEEDPSVPRRLVTVRGVGYRFEG